MKSNQGTPPKNAYSLNFLCPISLVRLPDQGSQRTAAATALPPSQLLVALLAQLVLAAAVQPTRLLVQLPRPCAHCRTGALAGPAVAAQSPRRWACHASATRPGRWLGPRGGPYMCVHM